MVNRNALELDERPIHALLTETRWVGVTLDEVDEIYLVMERGEMGYVPWFEIRRGGVVTLRINGRFVSEVIYKEFYDAKS